MESVYEARRRRAGQIATLAFVTTLALASTAQAAFPGRNGRLAVSFGFECAEEGSQIGTIKPDGSDLRLLNSCPGFDAYDALWPDWSADGRQILFHQGGPRLMAADGSAVRDVPLAPTPGIWLDDKPSLAPDGRHLAYSRVRETRNGERVSIWRAALDGSGDRRLHAGSMPRWSPGGRRIAYVVSSDDVSARRYRREGGTWLMNARTGERIRRVSRRPATVLDWSPDGRMLLFEPDCFCRGERDLFVVARDGRRLRQLTDTPSRDESDAVWSPDGRRIAFIRGFADDEYYERRYSIWTMTARGTRQRRILGGLGRIIEFDQPGPTLSWQPVPTEGPT